MHVWIRNEPLVNSAINYPISNHINANTLRKTVNYAKNKGNTGYPKIEYSIWRYIACNKINIAEHVAWMYFESFFYISNYGTQKNMDLDVEIAKSKTKEEAEKFKEAKKIDLYQFIIYLYIQQFYSIDLKSSVMSREEWPVNRNDGGNDRRKSKEEMNFINFVTKNLDEIISLFLAEKSANQNDIISEEIIQALNFLFEGSIDNYNGIMPFSLFLKQPLVQSKMSDGKIYGKNLITFLKTYLEINPFGLNSCLGNGKRIGPSYLGGSNDPRKVGKIITNRSTAPFTDFIVFITQVLKQTLIEVSDAFRHAGLYIEKCVYSYIYILQPLRSCTIKKSRKSLFFIGPTQRIVTVDSCAECCIVTVARRVIIRNCSSCTFFLLTPSSPIILSGCDNIKLAPFNSSYPNLEEDALASGLSSALNLWDKPIVVAQTHPNHHGAGPGSLHHHWSIMEPAEFSLLAVPVDSLPPKGQHITSELVNRANEVFGVLPTEYEQELNKRYLNIEENLNLIQSASLNPEQKIMLQKFLETSFKENLQISGEQRQLDHLAIIYNNTNLTGNQSQNNSHMSLA